MTKDEAFALGVDPKIESDVLHFVTGGKVIKQRWVYDEEKSEGQYTYKVVDEPIYVAFDTVTLGAGVKLRDLFQFILDNPSFHPVVNSWCVEIATEGLTNIRPFNEQKDDPIEYLEIYRIFSLERDYSLSDEEAKSALKVLQGLTPSFHGIGFPLTSDSDFVNNGYKVGERVSFGLMGSKANELADIPLVLNEVVSLYEEPSELGTPNKVLCSFKTTYTLMDLVREIMWELSWFGPPADREAKFAEILEMKDEIDEMSEEELMDSSKFIKLDVDKL